MSTEKSAEAALPWGQRPLLRPVAALFDRTLGQQLHTGQLRLRLGRDSHLLQGREPGPVAELQLHHPLSFARRVAARGHLGLGEAYVAGDWDSPDLAGLLYLLAVNEPGLTAIEYGTWLTRLGALLRHRRRANTRSGSRRNIAEHYDLGNDFYRLWLDAGMTYSAALFGEADDSLEQAQTRKYQRLLQMLQPHPGQQLLEIGCGWGGFAEEAVRAGLQVTGLTLSSEQLAWARQRLAAPLQSGQVELQLRDYRDQTGQFDHIASIEMFEAVGERYWPVYMRQLRRLLRPGGRAALQVITIDECLFADYKASPDFIQRYIFPGGMLPTPARFDAAAREAGLRIGARHWFGQDYARTLNLWHQGFIEQRAAVRALGYDERFIRMWRYYLAYCEAGFRDRRIDVMQVVLEPDSA